MPRRIKLVIFDLDDTLTIGKTIWELVHCEMGTWGSHGDPYWNEFKRGRFGYNAFIRKDIACWKGLPVSRVVSAIIKVKYAPRLKETIRALKKSGVRTALVSSSLEIFARHVSKKFGIDHVHANVLEVRNGKLTGRITLKVPGKAKGRLVRELKRRLGLKKGEVLAIGDSVYDLPMFKEAGVCVTFKDAALRVKKHAHQIIAKSRLDSILKFT
jgi:phosphoserine phosphatase